MWASHQASALSQLLAEHGAQAIELPAIDIQPLEDNKELDRAILNLKDYQWLIFTSTNAISAFWQRLDKLKKDSRVLNGLKIIAIGPATTQALEAKGITPDLVPQIHTNEGIIEGLKKQNIDGQKFLLPRADIADKVMVEGLSKLGAIVDDIAVYRTVPAARAIAEAKKMLTEGKLDVITFTSSSTVSNLAAAFEGEPLNLNGAKIACIGPKTAETAVKAGLKVDIMPEEQTIPGLVTAIEEFFR